ncbi:MAG: patatin-like phospholipase family protein [Deferribacteres bacterium]|nr:patatin-like phospholipase family protein [candidate division KSB1 bacterium]MCB9501195.1 patatin-like phospholipase family protein [Deferribacteres bacterium]
MNNNHKLQEILVGLALSGGAIRGAAHIGILKTLLENKIRIDAISGTSAGAMVAALLAFDVSIEKMAELISNMNWYRISNFAIPKLGLLSNAELGDHYIQLLGDVNIEDANIPLSIVATDISTGEKVVLQRGNLAMAIRASAAVPGMYRPVEFDGRLLVDGMLVENTPISPLEEMGVPCILASHLSADRNYIKPDSLIDVMINAFEIAIDSNNQHHLQKADFVIAPDLSQFSRTNPDNIPALIEAGARDTRRVIADIKKLVESTYRRHSSNPLLFVPQWIEDKLGEK